MNMFKPVAADSVETYIAAVPAGRKETIETLHDLIQSTLPEFIPYFAQNMLGYGKFTYTNSKKKVVEWPIIALANQKNYISLYICAVKDNQYLTEKHKAELGQVSVGKSCVRFKRLDQLNLKGLKRLLKAAAQSPGF